MDPLELLELLKAKSDDEKHNLMLLVVHMMLTTTQGGEFKVSMEDVEAYCEEGDRDLSFERSSDGFVRLCAVTKKHEESKMSGEQAEEKAAKARALAEAFLSVLGEPKHGKH